MVCRFLTVQGTPSIIVFSVPLRVKTKSLLATSYGLEQLVVMEPNGLFLEG